MVFLYTSFDEKRSGLASDKFAENPEEYEKFADALEEISDRIRYLIYHKLI